MSDFILGNVEDFISKYQGVETEAMTIGNLWLEYIHKV